MGKARIGVVILAAGASSRLGRPKQLLPYGDSTLLQHAIDTATASVAGAVVVVLGAHAHKVGRSMKPGPAHVIINANWHEGMASSIRCGLQALQEVLPQMECAIIMLCDQPYVTTALLNELIALYTATQKPIVACRYNGIIGVPALFHQITFPELAALAGDAGARAIIKRHEENVAVVEFAGGAEDIDTEEDVLRLNAE